MKIVAVSNQKGGVGKTTLAFNLAHIMAAEGQRVLAIDNDPQGNLTQSMRQISEGIGTDDGTLNVYDGRMVRPLSICERLSLLAADIRLATVAERDFYVVFALREGLVRLSCDYDVCLIDCLPAFGYLNLAALNAAHGVLIPVTPAPYALSGMQGLMAAVRKAKKYHNPELTVTGIVINQVDGRQPVIEREMRSAIRNTYGDLVLCAEISRRVRVEESPSIHQAITDYDGGGKSAAEFKAAAAEILTRLDLRR